MRGLSAGDLLDVADIGQALDWTSRGVLLAASAAPGATAEACAALPLGVRDRLVMALRIQLFGRALAVRTQCRACATELSADIDLADLLVHVAPEPRASVRLELGSGIVEARMPTSDDLRAVASMDAADSEWALFERCTTVSGVLPDRALARASVAQALADADPLASLELDFVCEACGARFSAPLDIVACVWREVEAAAHRAAIDVHRLASAYGWHEHDILAMPDARRQRYLRLLAS